MKRMMMISFFIFLLVVNGCGTIYSTAVDERNMSTISADTTIKATIVQKFINDDIIKSLDISTGCYRAHVVLVGEYDTEDQKNHAIKIAEGVEGVQHVTAYLLPKKKDDLCGTAENLKIAGKVKAMLVGDKDIWSTNIDIKAIQCQVVLYGLVGSEKEINEAIAHAKSVEGVRGVKSFLESANQ
jgi:hyperosmotically inducible periplasmic protein